MTEPFRDTYWNIPAPLEYAIYLAAALTFAALLVGVYRRLRLWRRGTPQGAPAQIVERLRRVFVLGVVQSRLLGDRRAGVMHMAIFVASIVLFIGTALATLDYDLGALVLNTRFLSGPGYLAYELVLDLAGVLFLVGLAIAVYRRYVQKLPRLRTGIWRFGFTLILLLEINITGFLVEGLRLAAVQPTWSGWSPVGHSVAVLVGTLGMSEHTIRNLHVLVWIVHGGSALLLIASVPFVNLMHMITSPLNLFLSSLRAKGALPFIRNLEEIDSVGVGTMTEFPRSQLLALDACTECGRCEVVCPAWGAGQPLSPRQVVLDLRDHLATDGRRRVGHTSPDVEQGNVKATVSLVGDTIRPESIWACTTCYACADACPVLINPMVCLFEMRRHLVEQGKIPAAATKTLEQTLQLGSPWGQPRSQRTDWLGDLKPRIVQPGDQVEFLYWVGDTSAYDVEAQAIARAMIQLLQLAGLDVGILGVVELSDGDAARRMGEEGLFQLLARRNIELLGKYRFQQILTHCPHTYNTFKNEYPDLGGRFRVIHHSQLLLDLVQAGVFRLTQSVEGRVTYHDPCYLGRYHQVFDTPRNLLRALPGLGLVEMDRHRENALCCGAGGGLAWADVTTGQRVNYLRLREAEETGARMLATACPFCKIMLLDAARYEGLEHKIQVMDIAELVLASRPEGLA